MSTMQQKRRWLKSRRVVGVDVSKSELVCWEEHLGSTCFANTTAGWTHLQQWIGPPEQVVLGFESTGPYGKGFQRWFQEAAYSVVLVNPMHTSRLKELPDNNPSKNDRKDAMVIAELVTRGTFHVGVHRSEPYQHLLCLHRSRCRVTEQMVRLKNQRHAGAHGQEVWREERGWIREDLARLKKRQQHLDALLQQGLEPISYAAALCTIPGLGATTVARVLAETGDLLQYRSAEQVVALAGLNLAEHQSGTFRGKVRLSKRGRAELRRLLFMATLRLIQKERPLRRRYDHLVGKGKPKVSAIIACCRALVRMLVAVARRGTYRKDGEGFAKIE